MEGHYRGVILGNTRTLRGGTVEISGFGGLGVCMLASGTQDHGFALDRSRRIFPVGNIQSMPSVGE
jgi:hypothetical protein